MVERAELVKDASANSGPERKSTKIVVVEAATAFMRSILSMVLVLSRVAVMMLRTFRRRILCWEDDRDEPKADASSSLTIAPSPVANSD